MSIELIASIEEMKFDDIKWRRNEEPSRDLKETQVSIGVIKAFLAFSSKLAGSPLGLAVRIIPSSLPWL